MGFSQKTEQSDLNWKISHAIINYVRVLTTKRVMSSLKKCPLTEKWVSKEGIHLECGLPSQARTSLFGESVDFAHGWPNFKLVVELRHILRYDSLSTYCLLITHNSRVSFPDSLDRNEVIKLVIFIKKKKKKTSHSFPLSMIRWSQRWPLVHQL